MRGGRGQGVGAGEVMCLLRVNFRLRQKYTCCEMCLLRILSKKMRLLRNAPHVKITVKLSCVKIILKICLLRNVPLAYALF